MKKIILLTFMMFFSLLVFDVTQGRLFLPPKEKGAYIRYLNLDEDQYDFDEFITICVEVDTTFVYINVELKAVLYDPNNNQRDQDIVGYTTHGGNDDLQMLHLFIDRSFTKYIGLKWSVKVTLIDVDTCKVEEECIRYFWVGPILLHNFMCRNPYNPFSTKTTAFYDSDTMAYEYTLWNTETLHTTYSVQFKFYGPTGYYENSEPIHLPPGYNSLPLWAGIDIKDHLSSENIGSWYVEIYLGTDFIVQERSFTIARAREKYISVPFHYQSTKYYCGPAALEMIFDFYGEDVPQLEIADVAETESHYGTSTDRMRRAAHFSNSSVSVGNEMPVSISGYSTRKLGYGVFEQHNLSLDQLKEMIDNENPLIVLTWYNLSRNSGHYRVVVGYNDTHITFHDPWNNIAWGGSYGGPNMAVNYSTFLNLWAYFNNWGLFIHPWEVSLNISRINESKTFRATAYVNYLCPSFFSANEYQAFSCNAIIILQDGLTLAAGEAMKKILGSSNMTPHTSAVVGWIIELDHAGTYSILVEAEGIITGSVNAPYTYQDRIGATDIIYFTLEN